MEVVWSGELSCWCCGTEVVILLVGSAELGVGEGGLDRPRPVHVVEIGNNEPKDNCGIDVWVGVEG